MNEKKAKPDWWPKNPYPASVFPMSEEQYPEIIPDPKLRTALSGMLGRQFWNIASDAIWEAMLEAIEEALGVRIAWLVWSIVDTLRSLRSLRKL